MPSELLGRRAEPTTAGVAGWFYVRYHCNRLFGVDRARERGGYALLHRAPALRANRARHRR